MNPKKYIEIARINDNFIDLKLLFFGLNIEFKTSRLTNEFALYDHNEEILKRGFKTYAEAESYLSEMDYDYDQEE